MVQERENISLCGMVNIPEFPVGNVELDQMRADPSYDLANLLASKYDNIEDSVQTEYLNHITNSQYYSPNEVSQIFEDSQNLLSCFHLNCQSINAHWDNLTNLVHDLSSEKFAFDIVGLSEVFKVHKHFNYNIDGYHPFIYKTRPGPSEGRGGIGMYLNKSLIYKIREDLSTFIPHVVETLFVEITIENTSSHVVCGVIYRPNSPPLANMDVFSRKLA